MAMTPKLRNSVIAAIGGGAIAIASTLITGPTGNDGLEGVRYDPYQDVVGVWTVCYGHTGKDIMLGKKYTEAECRALLSKDLNAVARQINPYIQKPIPETMRGALLSLEDHKKAWLLWNYSENIRFEHQMVITQWAWAEFRGQLGTKKVAGKTMERLKKLTWLAAQDVKAELAGRETYEYQALAELVGVAKSTWTETYLPHWLALRSSFVKLDSDALISVTRSRSQQKATNLDLRGYK